LGVRSLAPKIGKKNSNICFPGNLSLAMKEIN